MGRGKESARRERSFGVRAACCRFPFPQARLREFQAATTSRRLHFP